MSDHTLSWAQRRELELELWLDGHLRALSDVEPGDLDDPEALRAIGTRAAELARVVEHLRGLRGDTGAVEDELADFAAALDVL